MQRTGAAQQIHDIYVACITAPGGYRHSPDEDEAPNDETCMPETETIARHAGQLMELTGIAIIMVGIVLATIRHSPGIWNRDTDRYRSYRSSVGRSILLGLEFLVAGDIILTVAVELTFRSLGMLAVVVVIRTFLSFSLELEIEGRLPWQRLRPRHEDRLHA